MTTYTVEYSDDAVKAIKKLDKPIRRRVIDAIEGLQSDPRPQGVKALKGSGSLRIRVGDWRIVYEVEEDVLVVYVITVGHRGAIYRNL